MENKLFDHIDDRVKGIIFDLDGTLINSMPLHYESYNEALREFGITYDKSLFLSRAGIPTQLTFEFIREEYKIAGLDPVKATALKRDYYLENLHKIELIHDVFGLLKKYHGSLSMSIGTGGVNDSVYPALSHTGLDKLIDIIVTVDDITNPKPAPDTFLKCAELMQLRPEDCIVLEDGPSGIEAAKKGGFQVLDVRNYISIDF